MNLKLLITLFTLTIALSGCSSGNGAGHWFHILFVIVPVGFILYILNKKIDDISESLFKRIVYNNGGIMVSPVDKIVNKCIL